MKAYEQLSLDERYQIETRLRLNQEPREIAKALKRHPSTIYRELRRNSEVEFVKPYLAARAQRYAKQRRVEKGAAQRKIQGELQQIIENKLRLSWSPEQICGRLFQEMRIRLSHETVYQHILRDAKNLGFYRYCLRFAGYKHHRFKKSKMAERTLLRKNWIDERPAAANDRTELGHWERDCLLGKRGDSALLTMIDRKSRFVRIVHVPRIETDQVAAATVKGLDGLPLRSVTNDNGIEFQRDEGLQSKLGVKIYFCNPHSPWERGSVENTNGLIRQYFSKGYDFDTLPNWAPSAVENTLNFRPRKVLGYRTPHEVFHQETLCLMTPRAMHFGLEFSSPS